MKRALLIALHFPPYAVASGYRRTLKFAEGLPRAGWQPIVLTASPSVFRPEDTARAEAPPEGIEIVRAFALDTQRHLAIAGRHPGLLALPDRWASWWLDAVRKGLQAIRRHRPSVLYSTYPVATAHLIGTTLARLSGLPWVADFRDPMIDELHPPRRAERVVRGWVERRTLASCARAVFTTPSACELYRTRYRALPADRFTVIPNGFDEESFEKAREPAPRPAGAGALRLLHSGVLYRDVRHPGAFFEALGRLHRRGVVTPASLQVILRACATEDFVRALARSTGVEALVRLEPGVPYVEALGEMMAADGLLLLQGAGADRQVPAKLYEYLRAGRPILALTGPEGDTARVLRSVGTGTIARMDDADDIEARLEAFLDGLRAGSLAGCPRAAADRFSRAAATRSLETVLDELSEPGRGPR